MKWILVITVLANNQIALIRGYSTEAECRRAISLIVDLGAVVGIKGWSAECKPNG